MGSVDFLGRWMKVTRLKRLPLVFGFGFFLFVVSVGAQETLEPTQNSVEVDTDDYEIDYEEETDSTGESEAEGVKPSEEKGKPVHSKKTISPIDRNVPSSQGTRSKNKFAPFLRSETKSIYKKNGKPLDVDTD